MPPIVVMFFVLFVVLAIVAAVVRHLAAKMRRDELTALARRLGFSFDPTKRRGRPPWGEPFELFRRNNPYGIKNHLHGEWRGLSRAESRGLSRAESRGLSRAESRGLSRGDSRGMPRADSRGMPANIFDYTYYSESTNSKGHTSRHYSTRTVVALELPQSFPGIVIKPDSAFREFFEFIAGADIDFESDEFNKRFYVWADDRKFAYAVVTAPMMDFLLRARGAARDLALQIVGHRAIFFRERKLGADGIRHLLQFAADFLEKIPDYVKKDYARG
jgi:hypothetical protein